MTLVYLSRNHPKWCTWPSGSLKKAFWHQLRSCTSSEVKLSNLYIMGDLFTKNYMISKSLICTPPMDGVQKPERESSSFTCQPSQKKFCQLQLFIFIVVRALNIRSTLLTNFKSTILLMIGTMLYRKSLELIYLSWLKLYAHWQVAPHFLLPQPLATTSPPFFFF